MSLPPKFQAHRLLLTSRSPAIAAGAAPVHTLEVFLDYVCPFSAKMFKTLYTALVPKLEGGRFANRLQIIFRQQVQPWHPSSTLVHEAALAVQNIAVAQNRPRLFWDYSAALFADQAAYMDVNVVNEGRNATYRRLATLAAKVSETSPASPSGVTAVDAEALYQVLAIPTTPAADGSVNVGNGITVDLKWVIKYARLLSIHVSPTVIFDGVVANDISSSFTAEQWLAWLEKNAPEESKEKL